MPHSIPRSTAIRREPNATRGENQPQQVARDDASPTAQSASEQLKTTRIATALHILTSRWVLITFVVSSAVGWSAFNISPLQPLEEIAQKQQEHRRKEEQLAYKQRMVGRHLSLADSFLNVGRLDEAGFEYDKVLKLDADNADAHFGKLKSEVFGPIAAKTYDPEATDLRLRLLLKERPDDPHVLSFQGEIDRVLDRDLSIAKYRQAISNDPDVAIAYGTWSRLRPSKGARSGA